MAMEGILLLLQLPFQAATSATGQSMFGGPQANLSSSAAKGWAAFLDLGILPLAATLGATIGFHPATKHTVDNLDEAELAPVFVMYAVIGAVIGVAGREYGTVVGFVVFGI